jgi:hypothetical protein
MVATTPSSTYLADVFHGLLPFEDDQVDRAYLGYLEAGQLPASESGCKSVLIIGCFAGEHASLKRAWIEGAIEPMKNAALVGAQDSWSRRPTSWRTY